MSDSRRRGWFDWYRHDAAAFPHSYGGGQQQQQQQQPPQPPPPPPDPPSYQHGGGQVDEALWQAGRAPPSYNDHFNQHQPDRGGYASYPQPPPPPPVAAAAYAQQQQPNLPPAYGEYQSQQNQQPRRRRRRRQQRTELEAVPTYTSIPPPPPPQPYLQQHQQQQPENASSSSYYSYQAPDRPASAHCEVPVDAVTSASFGPPHQLPTHHSVGPQSNRGHINDRPAPRDSVPIPSPGSPMDISVDDDEKDDDEKVVSFDERKPLANVLIKKEVHDETLAPNQEEVDKVVNDDDMSAILQSRIRQFRARHGVEKTMAIVALKALAMIALCHNRKTWPTDENLFQSFIHRANAEIVGDRNIPNWKLVDGVLRRCAILKTDASGFEWNLDKIKEVLAAIASDGVDLQTILKPVTVIGQSWSSNRSNDSTRKGPYSAGGPQEKLLQMILCFEKTKNWPRNANDLDKFLKKEVQFLLLKSGTKMKEQRNKVEAMLKSFKYLDDKQGYWVWNHQTINKALANANMRQLADAQQSSAPTKSPTNNIDLTDDDLHEQVVALFNFIRYHALWPLTVEELDDRITCSNVLTKNHNVEMVRSEILRRVLAPRGYVVEDNSDCLSWQMDAVEKGLIQFGHAAFACKGVATTEPYRKIATLFQSSYQLLSWPDTFHSLKQRLQLLQILESTTEQEVICTFLLPYGFISINKGGVLSWHYQRIHAAFGMPARGEHDKELRRTADKIAIPNRHITVAAACTCHNIFMAMKYWPQQRTELVRFLDLETDETIARWMNNIHPPWDVAGKVQRMLEPLFAAAKLLEVDTVNDFSYSWSLNNNVAAPAAAAELTSKREDSTTIGGQALERHRALASAPSGQTGLTDSQMRAPSIQPQENDDRHGASVAQSNIKTASSGAKRSALPLPADSRKKQKIGLVEGLPAAPNERDPRMPNRDNLKARLAAAKNSLSNATEVLERAKELSTIVSQPTPETLASIRRFQRPPPRELPNVTGLGKTLMIRHDASDDPSEIHFADAHNVDDIIALDDERERLKVKSELKSEDVKAEASSVQTEPTGESTATDKNEDSLTVAEEARKVSNKESITNQKSQLLKRKKEVEMMTRIATMEKLLAKKESLLEHHTRLATEYAEQFESGRKLLRSANARFTACNRQIPELELDITGMDEMITERVALITRKRQEILRDE